MSTTTARAQDPICGMIVDQATALKAERDGTTFYFCSEHCRQKLTAAPADASPAEEAGLNRLVSVTEFVRGTSPEPVSAP